MGHKLQASLGSILRPYVNSKMRPGKLAQQVRCWPSTLTTWTGSLDSHTADWGAASASCPLTFPTCLECVCLRTATVNSYTQNKQIFKKKRERFSTNWSLDVCVVCLNNRLVRPLLWQCASFYRVWWRCCTFPWLGMFDKFLGFSFLPSQFWYTHVPMGSNLHWLAYRWCQSVTGGWCWLDSGDYRHKREAVILSCIYTPRTLSARKPLSHTS